jgi:hypothetical protein
MFGCKFEIPWGLDPILDPENIRNTVKRRVYFYVMVDL